ncbi:hypothetical protein PMAYCL1PPCAC_31686 [Pristionchus mayeri]|uniref:SHSP domain-containing protein n=1 Tax=Pristionchus mayeri TaxID=1317129 RepID=A0AAN5DDH9_9BILA|nr:hypothetical protein PMAYCL1PPCAC_31686 [Pristionchus mayeri]
MSLRRNKRSFNLALVRAFDQMFEDEQRDLWTPNWSNVPAEIELSLGGAIGDVENTNEKFAVNVDVSYFEPEEVKVNLDGNELTIEGSHEEKSDECGSIKRSFIRKYHLPKDTNLESVRPSLSDLGILTVEVAMKTQDETQSRAIPITRR